MFDLSVGEANVLQEFEITEKKKKVKVAGCRCVKGILKKDAMYRLIREQETLYTGKRKYLTKKRQRARKRGKKKGRDEMILIF